jgi:hypothetical protein
MGLRRILDCQQVVASSDVTYRIHVGRLPEQIAPGSIL